MGVAFDIYGAGRKRRSQFYFVRFGQKKKGKKECITDAETASERIPCFRWNPTIGKREGIRNVSRILIGKKTFASSVLAMKARGVGVGTPASLSLSPSVYERRMCKGVV